MLRDKYCFECRCALCAREENAGVDVREAICCAKSGCEGLCALPGKFALVLEACFPGVNRGSETVTD